MFHFPTDQFRKDRPRRPLLIARWTRGQDGRLFCRWVRVPEYH